MNLQLPVCTCRSSQAQDLVYIHSGRSCVAVHLCRVVFLQEFVACTMHMSKLEREELLQKAFKDLDK